MNLPTTKHLSPLVGLLLGFSGLLAFVALLAFSYVTLTVMQDYGSWTMFADALSVIKIGFIGFICWFLSYLSLLLATVVLFYSRP